MPLESAKSALQITKEYLDRNEQARVEFVEQHMEGIIENILNRESPKEESADGRCIEECLKVSTIIVAKYIDAQLKSKREVDVTILVTLLREEAAYYQEKQGRIARYNVLDTFHVQGGFACVAEYVGTKQYRLSSLPKLEFLLFVMGSIYDLLAVKGNDEDSLLSILADLNESTAPGLMRPSCYEGPDSLISNAVKGFASSNDRSELTFDCPSTFDERKKSAICLGKAALRFVRTLSLDNLLQEQSLDSTLRSLLILVGDILSRSTEGDSTYCNHAIQELVMQTITSDYLELKHFGWHQIPIMVQQAQRQRPPPRQVVVSKAGYSFANGTYTFKSNIPEVSTVIFERGAPKNGREGVESKVFLCSVRGKSVGTFRWTICSERFDGSMNEIYVADSNCGTEPPSEGWRHAEEGSKKSLPTVRSDGFGETTTKDESNTAEHELVTWAVANKVLELLFSESRSANFISWVVYASHLIKLMAFMNIRCVKETLSIDSQLNLSHVCFAWNALTVSTDDDESYSWSLLLALVFPYLPDDMAMWLLREMRRCLISDPIKVLYFFKSLTGWSAHDKIDGFYLTQSCSETLQLETKKLMWSIRIRFKSLGGFWDNA